MKFWTTAEDRTLRRFYPVEGAAVIDRLPGRSKTAIATRASTIGLRFLGPKRGKPQMYRLTDEIRTSLRRAYVDRDRTLAEVSAEHGVPRWRLKRWAADMGLTRPAAKEPAWSEDEIELLKRLVGRDVEYVQRRFRAAGFHRTLTALQVKRKRLSLPARAPGFYSATELAKQMGVDAGTVSMWIRNGWMEARRRGTDRTEAQGGDMWWIREDEARAFIIGNPHLVDLRKIRDTEWFLHLVAGIKGDGRQHIRRRAAA